MNDAKLRLGVSACLLGNEVRYDGGHKRNPFLTDLLGPFVEWVPICPEVEAGFGTPREAMHLVQDGGEVRLLTVRTRRDVTSELERAVAARLRTMAGLDLDGYVLKKDSPSCGLFRVKLYGPSGAGKRSGRGLFAAGLADAQPLLPLEEEGRLGDPRLRENFIERVFAYRRLRELAAGAIRAGALMRFHARHKLLLLFAGGVMNLTVIVGLTTFLLIEKLMPDAVQGGRVSGTLLVASGLYVAVLR